MARDKHDLSAASQSGPADAAVLAAPAEPQQSFAARATYWQKSFGRFIGRQPLTKIIGASLLRRILVANMLGLLGLLLALL